MKTVTNLLETLEFKSNQSELARALNVNRGTLRKYIKDTKGELHCIREFSGVRQLMVLTSKAKNS